MKLSKMQITNAHGYTTDSLKRIKTKYKDICKSENKINVIMLCMDGHGRNEISKLLNTSEKTVTKYIKTFNESGLDVLLKYNTSPGRTPFLSEQEQELVCDMITNSTPYAQGCGESHNWTTTEIRAFINNEFKKDMTPAAILKMLKKKGYSFTRPTYVLARASKKNC